MSYDVAIFPNSEVQKALRGMLASKEALNDTVFTIAPEPKTAALTPAPGWTLSAPWFTDYRPRRVYVREGCHVSKQKKQKRKAQRMARRMQRRHS
jgi:hypothetical protein